MCSIRVMKEKTVEILRNLGYANVRVNTIFHQYMAAFPMEHKRAEELVLQSAVTAAMSKATRLLVKTPAAACAGPALTTSATSGLPLAFSPAATPAAVNPRAAVTVMARPRWRSIATKFPWRANWFAGRCCRPPQRNKSARFRQQLGYTDDHSL